MNPPIKYVMQCSTNVSPSMNEVPVVALSHVESPVTWVESNAPILWFTSEKPEKKFPVFLGWIRINDDEPIREGDRAINDVETRTITPDDAKDIKSHLVFGKTLAQLKHEGYAPSAALVYRRVKLKLNPHFSEPLPLP